MFTVLVLPTGRVIMSNAKERVFHAANLDAVNAAHPHMANLASLNLLCE